MTGMLLLPGSLVKRTLVDSCGLSSFLGFAAEEEFELTGSERVNRRARIAAGKDVSDSVG